MDLLIINQFLSRWLSFWLRLKPSGREDMTVRCESGRVEDREAPRSRQVLGKQGVSDVPA